MCGRYTQTSDVKSLQKRFGFAERGEELKPRYNIAPGQDAPVVLLHKGRKLGMFRWGLVPSWADDPKIGYRMINARAETAAEKPAYRKAFAKRRCLVPADGFYEWPKQGPKVPRRYFLRGGEPFAFAGLWENSTFTILTTGANPLVGEIHDRMPVILPREAEEAWLDPKTPPAKLRGLLLPFDAGKMEVREASQRLNAAKLDEPSLLEPDAAAAPPPKPGGGQMELF